MGQGLGCSGQCWAPSSRQQPQPGHLGRQEGVDDEDNGLGAGVKVQLLQKKERRYVCNGESCSCSSQLPARDHPELPKPTTALLGPWEGLCTLAGAGRQGHVSPPCQAGWVQ